MRIRLVRIDPGKLKRKTGLQDKLAEQARDGAIITEIDLFEASTKLKQHYGNTTATNTNYYTLKYNVATIKVAILKIIETTVEKLIIFIKGTDGIVHLMNAHDNEVKSDINSIIQINQDDTIFYELLKTSLPL